MSKFTRILQAGTFAIIAASMLAGPGVMTAQAEKTGDKPVLEGPKSDKKHDGEGKKFNGERKRGGDAMHKLLGELKLSEDQKEQVKDIMVEAATARKEWYKTNGEKMSSLQKELKEAREAKDEAKAKATFEQMKELRSTHPKPQENMAKIRALLTEEQQTIFDAKIQEMKEHRMGAKAKGRNKEAGDKEAGKKGKPGKNKKGDDKKSDTNDRELDL